jgi:hypothetical protein
MQGAQKTKFLKNINDPKKKWPIELIKLFQGKKFKWLKTT